MLSDKISKPARGQFFPLPQGAVVAQIVGAGFAVHSYHKRLPLTMQNCNVPCLLGHQLASFLRMGYLAVFSLPETVNRELAASALEYAIGEFHKIDQTPHLHLHDQQFVVYRAYLGPLGVTSITQHTINAGHRYYLQLNRAAQISKSQGTPKNERLLRQACIA